MELRFEWGPGTTPRVTIRANYFIRVRTKTHSGFRDEDGNGVQEGGDKQASTAGTDPDSPGGIHPKPNSKAKFNNRKGLFVPERA